jgi:hypothetical protein
MPGAHRERFRPVKLEVEFWQLLLLIISVLSSFWGMAKMLLAQVQKNMDEKFKAMSESQAKADDISRRIERELMQLKAELPREYVRAENYIRDHSQLLTKMDQVHLRLEAFFTSGQR